MKRERPRAPPGGRRENTFCSKRTHSMKRERPRAPPGGRQENTFIVRKHIL